MSDVQPECVDRNGRSSFFGDQAVPPDRAPLCVITRFGLKRRRDIVSLYLVFRRLRRAIDRAEVPGLLHFTFAASGAKTFFTISFWTDVSAIGRFGTAVPDHVLAAHAAIHRLAEPEHDQFELWSTKWRLAHASNNLTWPGFNLADHLGAEA